MSIGRPDAFGGGAPLALLGDVGGTHARFALDQGDGAHALEVLACADYGDLEQALRHYLRMRGDPPVREAAIAIATPVLGDHVAMTNRGWSFSTEALRRAMRWDRLVVLNDFTALALALPDLPSAACVRVGGEPARPGQPAALLGPGTGLGVSGLLWTPEGRAMALAGEGGHVSFAPSDEDEVDLWRFARARHGHVSAERLLSGPGLALIHAWARGRHGGEARDAPAIVEAGCWGADKACVVALDMFCAALGTVAADLALTLGAFGGVYLGGGIVARMGDVFVRSRFRERFEAKGRFGGYLAKIPVFVIHGEAAALPGAARALRAPCNGVLP